MTEDVYEPLARYRDEFKGKFHTLAKQKFVELVKKSGIDVTANRRQVAVVRDLEQSLSSATDKRSLCCCLMVLFYLGTVICLGIAFTQRDSLGKALIVWPVIGGIASFGLAIWLTTLFCKFGDIVKNLKQRVESAKDIAWRQMEPLNRLYTWDITTNLIQKTVPRLTFDRFFTAKRLSDLKRLYGWDDSFNDERSIVFAQSGVINGNPFLIGEYLEMNWGEEVYTGTLDIEWEEEEEDSEGNVYIVTRSETLTASTIKPIPRYSKEKLLIYGNDAAPNLSFSRQSSSLSGAEDGLITTMRKKWRLSRLKSLSRDMDKSFTLMGNHEFEMLFNAKDRDNEVEFRLLYTALAQMQTLALLKDKEIGFGDDFSFIKQRRLNFLLSKHLNDGTIDTAPEHFYDWDFDNAARTFMQFNQKYFKDIYFAFAPLLAIPLYQQTRTHEDIWEDVILNEPSSFWEHESTANYYGGDKFEHPDCITENILKTRVLSRENGVSRVEVTAYGFRGVERVAYEEVLGGDGHYHSVPIEWVEYLPVKNVSDLMISEGPVPSAKFAECYRCASDACYRRSILSFIPGLVKRGDALNELPPVHDNDARILFDDNYDDEHLDAVSANHVGPMGNSTAQTASKAAEDPTDAPQEATFVCPVCSVEMGVVACQSKCD